MHETYGGGVKFGPLERELVGDPRFLFFFLKGIIKVHKLKIDFQDFQYQILIHDLF